MPKTEYEFVVTLPVKVGDLYDTDINDCPITYIPHSTARVMGILEPSELGKTLDDILNKLNVDYDQWGSISDRYSTEPWVIVEYCDENDGCYGDNYMLPIRDFLLNSTKHN